jgi:TonB family protein
MPRITIIRATVVMAVLMAAGRLMSQTTDAQRHLSDLITSTTLDRKGTDPWHLRVNYQLFDVAGKPTITGTAEEWWIAPGRLRQTFSPELKGRDAALVQLLLEQVIHPISPLELDSKSYVVEAKRTLGKTEFTCLLESESPIGPLEIANWFGQQYCIEPGTNSLRISYDSVASVVARNSLAHFRNLEIGFDVSLAFNGKTAIKGHIGLLENYQPDKNDPPPLPPSPIQSGQSVASKLVNKVQPTYPLLAKQMHKTGTVVLYAVISTEGKVVKLDVIASPYESLSGAALAAVKQWTYKPYLVDGVPTELKSVVTVSFHLAGY